TDCFARAGAAAALPVSDPVFGLVGEIGVRRTKSFAHCFVRFRPRVFISNKNCYRGTKGFPFENTGHNFTAIGLLSLRCYSALTGTTTIEFSLNLSARERDPWRTTIDDHTDTATVRFAESGDAKKLAKGVAHLGLKNKSTRRDHNQGTAIKSRKLSTRNVAQASCLWGQRASRPLNSRRQRDAYRPNSRDGCATSNRFESELQIVD